MVLVIMLGEDVHIRMVSKADGRQCGHSRKVSQRDVPQPVGGPLSSQLTNSLE